MTLQCLGSEWGFDLLSFNHLAIKNTKCTKTLDNAQRNVKTSRITDERT